MKYGKFIVTIIFLGSFGLGAELPEELINTNLSQGNQRTFRALPNWSILIYMEADNNLAPFATSNIQAMCKAPSSPNVNVLVQWNKPSSRKTHRLKIDRGMVFDVGSLNQPMGLVPAKELSDAIGWMKDRYPANHYMVILWNHGSGIDKMKRNWLRPLCFQGQTAAKEDVNDSEERGILYNDTYNTYLNTDQMQKVFEDAMVKLNQPIDIVGMDACLMAMIEICYALKDSTKILVGSENVEMGDGWNYGEILTRLNTANGNLSPEELARVSVAKYQSLYIQSDPMFTQSAIKIENIVQLKDCLNQVVLDLDQLKNLSAIVASKLISGAVSSSICFQRDYVDIGNFLDKLYGLSVSYVAVYQNFLHEVLYQKMVATLAALQRDIQMTKKALSNAVLATSSGINILGASGLSIYLPNNFPATTLSSIYFQSVFAKKSLWSHFLTMFCRRDQSLETKLISEQAVPLHIKDQEISDFWQTKLQE